MEKKILIVDDEEDHRFIIEECLNNGGYTNLVFAKNGEDGVKMAVEDKPDVVVTDTNLPDIDGFEVCKRIKAEAGDVKVVIMTGNAYAVNFPKSREVGADEYTVKTGNCGEIIWSIRRCLAGS